MSHPPDFLFGFAQVLGVGTFGAHHPPFDMALLDRMVSDVGVNTLRMFVHPTLLGVTQRTWAGPEAVAYSDYCAGLNFSAFDYIADPIIARGLYLIVMPLPVDEYVNYLWADSLEVLNNASHVPPLNYSGIDAEEELTYLAGVIASRLATRHPATAFGVAFTEMSGSGKVGPARRPGEQAKWRRVTAAVKAVAPLAQVYGPELSVVLSWYAQGWHAPEETCARRFGDLWSGADMPAYDRIGNYAQVFDAPSISFYSLAYFAHLQGQVGFRDPMALCGGSLSDMQAITDVALKVVRDHVVDSRWLWAEHGWGSTSALSFPGGSRGGVWAGLSPTDALHQNWASAFLALDHARGAVFWQVRDACADAASCVGGGVFAADGSASPSLAAWRVIGARVVRHAGFFSARHDAVNAEGLPVELVGVMANADVAGGVVTRLLGEATLAVYVDAVAPPSGAPAAVLLTGARNRTLRCALCDAVGVWANASVRVAHDDAADAVRVSGLTPRRFYLFDVVDAPPAARAAEQPGAPAGCTADLDCSLNGACVSGACVCDGGWRGDACDQLRFGPASREGGLHNATMASWGGNAIWAEGRYHMFAAAMANECGLEAWGSNSYVVRAEAAALVGPFEAKEAVVGPFAHNPTVRQLPDGSVLLYMIGDGNSSHAHPKDCRNGSTAAPASAARVGGARARGVPTAGAPFGTGIWVAHAPGVHGPWEVSQVMGVNRSDDLCSGWTNPSPHVAPDGSVTLAFQSSRCEPSPAGHYVAMIGVARAPSWRGPYALLGPSAVKPEEWWCVAGQAEDPFLWQSARGWHLLMHGMCPSGVAQARYAFSGDAVGWTNSPRQAYSYRVAFDDGSEHAFARVERPQLGFSNTSTGALGPPDVLYSS